MLIIDLSGVKIVLTIIVLLLEVIVLLYLLYINIKRHKESMKFYKDNEVIMKHILEDIQNRPLSILPDSEVEFINESKESEQNPSKK